MRNVTIIGAAILIFLLMGIGMACARLPASGDNVRISTACGLTPLNYEGTINEIGNGFVDLMCNKVIYGVPEEPNTFNKLDEFNPSKNICIGIGAIIRIEWI